MLLQLLIECERLQTLPDNYTAIGIFDGKEKPISNTQRYKMLGNGWTVDVIAHILSFIPEKYLHTVLKKFIIIIVKIFNNSLITN